MPEKGLQTGLTSSEVSSHKLAFLMPHASHLASTHHGRKALAFGKELVKKYAEEYSREIEIQMY
jgi:hypothetical protein